MWDILSWLFFIVFIAALIVLGGLLLRGYMTNGTLSAGFPGGLFGPKPERRLDVVDQANVDGRRRLVLIRRDDVEHLIMTGGPVDVVIETNISDKRHPVRSGEVVEASTPVFTRAPRTFGTAVGES